MNKLTRCAPQGRDRAVLIVLEHRDEYPSDWAAIESVAGKIGRKAETLWQWQHEAERDAGVRSGPMTAETEWLKHLKPKNRELRQANEILQKTSPYFAQAELDHPFRR